MNIELGRRHACDLRPRNGRLDQDGANHQQADEGSIMNGARMTEIHEKKGSNFVDLSTKDGAGLDQ